MLIFGTRKIFGRFDVRKMGKLLLFSAVNS